MAKQHTTTVYLFLLAVVVCCFAVEAYGEILTYTSEAVYLNALKNRGYTFFQEGFEDDGAWGFSRDPDSAGSVVSKEIEWTTNHPSINPITTGDGAAVTGNYGVFDPLHGVATGSAVLCDVDNPPADCLFHDGVSGARAESSAALVGVGGWFDGTSGARIAVILDQGAVVELGGLLSNQLQFLGIINTGEFTHFEFREIESKIGNKLLIFADDFTFGVADAGGCIPNGSPDNGCDGVDDDCNGEADDGYVVDAICGIGQCKTNNKPSSCDKGIESPCVPGIPSPEDSELTCTDTLDNDCDGVADAVDTDCEGSGAKRFPWNMFLPAIIHSPSNPG